MLKIYKKAFWIVLLFGGGLWIGSMFTSNADGLVDPNMPGTANDPIVTKSYVDEAVKTLLREELSTQSVNEDQIKKLIEDSKKGSARLTVVELMPGQKLYGGEGAEFIVRGPGKAIAFSGDASGIPDLTGAKDLTAGTVVPHNHLLLFPREGRGIQPDPAETDKNFIIVRGPYLHLDEDGKQL